MELGLVIVLKMLKILSGGFSYRFFSLKMLQDIIYVVKPQICGWLIKMCLLSLP